MPLDFYWIDAFSDRPFAGNPAGVVPLQAWLPDEQMQAIAFENGLAETAFFVPVGPGRYHLRWFTPTVEVDLCGHATLASAHALFTQLGYTDDTLTFDSRSGPLMVTREDDDLIQLDFPSRPPVPKEPPPEILQGLGAKPLEYAEAKACLAVYATTEEVLALRPNHAALAKLPQYGIIASAPGHDCDFVSRFFAPQSGVPEDPVTGSAHCVLTPYWAAKLGKTKLHARQVSPRGGDLWCELRGERVLIAGHARLYLTGQLHV